MLEPPALVTLLGDINIDVFMQIPNYPQPGEDGMAQQLVMRTGGSVSNCAIVLARLGIPTRLISRTGDDVWADLALATLRREGIGLECVQRDPSDATGLIFIPVTPDGERTMFSYRGANVDLQAEEIRPACLAGSRILHVSGYSFMQSSQREAAWQALDQAVELGLEVSLDCGIEPTRVIAADLRRLLAKTTLIVLGMEEGAALTGQTTPEAVIAALLERGVRQVGLKLGRAGAILATPTERAALPGFAVPTVDTTGAGDAFSAALLFGRLRGLSLPAACMLANGVGALSTTAWGGGASLPGREQMVRFFESQHRGEQHWDAHLEAVLEAIQASPASAASGKAGAA